MAALKGDLAKISDFKRKLKTLPVSIAHDVAQRAAPEMTGLSREAYDGGRTVYGGPRPAGVAGQALTLKRTGDTERGIKFGAFGSIVRCVLGTKYAKYLIGKYEILPNGRLPAAWSAKLRDLVATYKVKAAP